MQRGAKTVDDALLARLAGDGQAELRYVDPRGLQPNPYQPRQYFDPESLQELADSIRAQGVLQPLIVRETADGLELLAGERRQRAAILADQPTVPARVVSGVTDTAAATIALVENLARADLTPWEEAQGLAQLRYALTAAGERPNRDHLASLVGRSAGSVSESLGIADRLSDEVVSLSGVDRQTLTKLPKTALYGASRPDAAEERARLIRLAVSADAPGKAVQEQARDEKPKRGRPVQPYTLQARQDGRVSFSIKRPSEIDSGAAQEILDRLEPVLRALRERARASSPGIPDLAQVVE